jgi:hypothetical protein
MKSTARPREQIVEYQKWFMGANVGRAVFPNDSALTSSAMTLPRSDNLDIFPKLTGKP